MKKLFKYYYIIVITLIFTSCENIHISNPFTIGFFGLEMHNDTLYVTSRPINNVCNDDTTMYNVILFDAAEYDIFKRHNKNGYEADAKFLSYIQSEYKTHIYRKKAITYTGENVIKFSGLTDNTDYYLIGFKVLKRGSIEYYKIDKFNTLSKLRFTYKNNKIYNCNYDTNPRSEMYHTYPFEVYFVVDNITDTSAIVYTYPTDDNTYYINCLSASEYDQYKNDDAYLNDIAEKSKNSIYVDKYSSYTYNYIPFRHTLHKNFDKLQSNTTYYIIAYPVTYANSQAKYEVVKTMVGKIKITTK